MNLQLLQGPSSKLCVVSGNESCDYDSIVSALVYAHYISTPSTDSDTDVNGDRHSITLPLLQTQRVDFVNRQDAKLLLEELGIDASSLLFLDDVTPEVLMGVGELSVVLVDHNSPTGMIFVVQ